MPGARASRYRVYGVIGLHIGNYPNYPASFLLLQRAWRISVQHNNRSCPLLSTLISSARGSGLSCARMSKDALLHVLEQQRAALLRSARAPEPVCVSGGGGGATKFGVPFCCCVYAVELHHGTARMI